ncbi:MAG: Clp protease ClpP [Bacteroidales bacterium]|nr:Clp protease ClpP [Bacteroidales bacterium]
MKEPRDKRSPFRRSQVNFRVALTETTAEILLYDEISWWGVTVEAFKRELDAITVPTINLRINSPGGDIFDSLAIYNALRDHPAHIVSHIDGLAASMASVIALAGDEVRMAENAFYMVHNPWVMVIGNADDLRKEADLLEKVTGSLVMAYAEKTGKGTDEIGAWMDSETWFTAADALDAGFVDAVVVKDKADDLAAAASFDLAIFGNVPDALLEEQRADPTIRDLERALRDAGLSQIAAKQYIAAGRAAASRRDVERDGARDATPQPTPYTFPVGF